MLVGGLLFLEEHASEQRLREMSELQRPVLWDSLTDVAFQLSSRDMSPQHRLMSYYGYSFESYCTKSRPQNDDPEVSDSPVGWGGDVNTNVQHCHVVKTKLG